MIAIIDSGGANIASVQFALERLGARSVLTRDAAEIAAADRVLLPGVGAAPVAMKALGDAQLIEPIRQLRQPVLGICLGMQLLFGRSFEGIRICLVFWTVRATHSPHQRGDQCHIWGGIGCIQPPRIRCWLVWMIYRMFILCIAIMCQ